MLYSKRILNCCGGWIESVSSSENNNDSSENFNSQANFRERPSSEKMLGALIWPPIPMQDLLVSNETTIPLSSLLRELSSQGKEMAEKEMDFSLLWNLVIIRTISLVFPGTLLKTSGLQYSSAAPLFLLERESKSANRNQMDSWFKGTMMCAGVICSRNCVTLPRLTLNGQSWRPTDLQTCFSSPNLG